MIYVPLHVGGVITQMAAFGERFALNNGIMAIIPEHDKAMMILPPINFPPSSEINSVNLIQVHRIGWNVLSPTKLSNYPVNLVKFNRRKTNKRNQCPTNWRNIYYYHAINMWLSIWCP